MKVTLRADIDFDDFVSDYKEDVIESLEAYEQFYIFEYKTLLDKYKLQWFEENWNKASLEQLESLLP